MRKELIVPVLKDTMKRFLPSFLMWTVFSVMFGFLAGLYGMPGEAASYGALLSLSVLTVSFFISFIKGLRHAEERKRALNDVTARMNSLPGAYTLGEEDFRTMAETIGKYASDVIRESSEAGKDMSDYYTAWVHQIKTPISVMRMELSGKEDEGSTVLRDELFRIEQYVDMVLQYVRLSSPGNDLVIKEYDLDEIIRASVRKHASGFIRRKLKLCYTPTERKIVTDSKWLGVILDQILSNAVKYTPQGSVSIGTGENGTLVIRDTGIGIAPEDLPRIFEKGYTGENGRADTRSSGLGLYLAGKAAERIGVKIDTESRPGEGTAFILHFEPEKEEISYSLWD